MKKSIVLMSLLIMCFAAESAQAASTEARAQLKFDKVARDKDKLSVTMTVNPEVADKKNVDVVSVYLLNGNEGLSPEEVLKSCDRMGLMADNDGACVYSTVIKKPEDTYIGQIAIRDAEKVCQKDGTIVLHFPLSSSSLRYEGSGKMHVWLRRDKQRSSNIESFTVSFEKGKEKYTKASIGFEEMPNQCLQHDRAIARQENRENRYRHYFYPLALAGEGP